MREQTIKLYQYSELSDEAKEKARQWYMNIDDGLWAWENTTDDAKNIGLVLESLSRDERNQGSFEKSALDCAERIIKEHGEGCETRKTAEKYIKALRVLPEEGLEDAYQGIEDMFLQAILEDYRVMLEKEQEYQQSEEYIAETMAANEYEFTEDGKRF